MPRARLRGPFGIFAVLGAAFALVPLARAQPIPAAVPSVSASATVAPPSIAIGAPAIAGSGAVVNEEPPPELSKPTRAVDGWTALWGELAKSNIDMRIALDEIERAEAATRITWGGVLPTLTGTVSLTHIPPKGTPTSFLPPGDILQANLTLVAPLINLRAIHAIGTSRVLEDVAHLSALEVRRKVGLALARASVAIVTTLRLAELNRIGLAASLERLSLTRKRLAAGVGDARDLVRAQQDVAVARAAIAPADEQLRQAREGLASLLGFAGELGVGGDTDALERDVLGFCGDAKAGVRNDVLLAKTQIEVAERNVDDIALKFVPTLTAQLTVGESGIAFGGPYVAGWQVSGVLTIPLYDGGVRYGERRDRLALVDEARANETRIEVGSMIEIAQARRALDVALYAQASAKEARDLAREADRLARLAYAGGIGTNFDLIDAGRRLREAETQLVLQDLSVSSARIALPFLEGRCAGIQK